MWKEPQLAQPKRPNALNLAQTRQSLTKPANVSAPLRFFFFFFFLRFYVEASELFHVASGLESIKVEPRLVGVERTCKMVLIGFGQ